MDSNTEILRVTSKIVAAFQIAADTLEMIKDRKEKKKRKKDKEIEELLEIKILHKSLVEGATRCRKHCENRHQQFSPTFEAGDEIAIMALEDVHNSLQTEVIQALQIARAVENAILDLTALHEASITNRKDATRAMDQLCRRIMASMQFQPQQSINPSGSSMRSSFVSVPVSALTEGYDLPPSPPGSIISPRQSSHQRGFSNRTPTIGSFDDKFPQRSRQIVVSSPLSSINSPGDHSSSDLTIVNGPGSTVEEERQSVQSPDDSETNQTGHFTIHHSTQEADIVSAPPESITVTSAAPHYSQNPPLGGDKVDLAPSPPLQDSQTPQPAQQTEVSRNSTTTITTTTTITGTPRRGSFETFVDPEKPLSSRLHATVRPLCMPSIETVQDEQYDFEAPEAVSTDFEGMQPMSAHEQFSEKYLAFPTQADYAERLLTLPRGMDNLWLPLKRPAMHNRYHGFCKGAWSIRNAVHEGLDVQLTSTLKDPVIHWKCKECNFKSKSPNPDSLPNHILFYPKYNIRYRWMFLAKSHRDTEVSHESPESYSYGCMFCAAQGQPSASYNKLDTLFLHIVSKHKTSMMTPEILQKTKCIVGNVAHQTDNDWDLNVPETTQKGAGVVADELFVMASKLFGRRKGKRSKA